MAEAPLRIAPGGPPVGRSDPLIGALIEKFPPMGSTWSIEQRLVWLRMAAMAFDLAYGVDAPIEIKLAGVPTIMVHDAGSPPAPAAASKGADVGPRLGKQRVADQLVVICLDGMAWRGNKLILPSELGNGDTVWDFRPGDQPIDKVVWADGETREAHQLPPLQIFKG